MGLESEMVDVRVVLRKKESEVEQISEVASKLTKERDSVTQVVRQEFADRCVCACVCACVRVCVCRSMWMC